MNDFDFEALMDRLGTKARSKPQMVRAMVELTYGCNLRCVHCYNPTHQAKNELSTEQVFRILNELAAQGCLWVGFTGGELFTRRDTLEIMRYAKSLGLVTNILTNATMVTSTIAGQIQELEPHLVEVTIYGATAETYEKVTRVPGSFPKFVRGVDLLRERRIPTLIKLALMTLNLHEFEAMQEFARSRNLKYQVNTEIHPKVDGSREPLTYRLPPEKSFEIWRRISGEAQRKTRYDVREKANEEETDSIEEERCGSADGLFHCRCGKSSAAVTPYGQLNLCLAIDHPQYDLTRGSVAEGWQSLVDLVAKAQTGPTYECPQCSLTSHCTRGAQDSWLEQGRFDGPCIPHFKETAEQKAKFLEKCE